MFSREFLMKAIPFSNNKAIYHLFYLKDLKGILLASDRKLRSPLEDSFSSFWQGALKPVKERLLIFWNKFLKLLKINFSSCFSRYWKNFFKGYEQNETCFVTVACWRNLYFRSSETYFQLSVRWWVSFQEFEKLYFRTFISSRSLFSKAWKDLF